MSRHSPADSIFPLGAQREIKFEETPIFIREADQACIPFELSLTDQSRRKAMDASQPVHSAIAMVANP
jgi:hypothetical protein